MDTFLQALPWQGILNSPGSAWALLAVVLVIYVMYLNGKREERMQNTIDTSINNHSQAIERQTETLSGINNSMVSMNANMSAMQNTLCNVSNRVEDIEDVIFKDKKADQ